MISYNQVAELLAFAAVFDQRRADELDIRAWHQVATRQRWTASAAQRVIVEHYERGADRDRIDPATISDRLRAIRNRAAQTFDAPRIPDDLPNRDYPAWYRAQLAEHVDAALHHWGTTGDLPDPDALPAAEPIRTLGQLVAAAPPEHQQTLADATRRVTHRHPDQR